MGCNCGGKTRQTITTADAEAMRLASESGDRYIVTTPSGQSESFTSYTAAARFRRDNPGATLANVVR